MKELTAYVIDGHDVRIRPAPMERPWMEQTDQRFAYRCLPLNIANAHGWEILCAGGFRARWNGQPAKGAIAIQNDADHIAPALSHFGSGILTFHVPCLFRTDPGTDLFIMGPINRAKDGISALAGIIESDWSPYSFTMNWQFTRADWTIRFEKDEPFCHIFPIERGRLEGIVPRLRKLSEEPDLEAAHKAWAENRQAFNASLANPDSEAAKMRWQKTYFRGLSPDGTPSSTQHRSKLRLSPFVPKG